MEEPDDAGAPPSFVTGPHEIVEPEQHEAIFADDPVVCVLAGAGTGKTRVLTSRVARRIEDGSASASHTLVCTFSRKAAGELRTRLWVLGAGDVEAATFHRVALDLIARHRADRGERPLQIVADRRAVLASVLGGGNGPRAVNDLSRVDAEISWAKARLVTPEGYEEACRHSRRRVPTSAALVASHYARYEEALRRRSMVDLDGLLWHAGDLLEQDQAFARATRWWHRHLFVDEMQDVNEAQFRMLRLLAGERPDLFVVGDPDQSIYAWNGADPTLLRRVADAYAGTRVVTLQTNHRCSPEVVRIASAALGHTTPAPTVRPSTAIPRVIELSCDQEEALRVAREIWDGHRAGTRWSSTAVLARTNAQLAAIADALRAERVPYRLSGGDLGPASDVSSPASDDPWEREADPEEVDEAGGASTGADAHVEVGGHRGHGDLDEHDGVTLSTFHRAKGLQWRRVFVIGLSEGIVPWVAARSKAARDEERRLLYVALTRAEDELTCTWAKLEGDGSPQQRARPARRASPWLAPIQAAISELHAARSDTPAQDVTAHLERIRALLAAEPARKSRGEEDDASVHAREDPSSRGGNPR